jgi:hypothetical protein
MILMRMVRLLSMCEERLLEPQNYTRWGKDKSQSRATALSACTTVLLLLKQRELNKATFVL